jgi:hypothetical protein
VVSFTLVVLSPEERPGFENSDEWERLDAFAQVGSPCLLAVTGTLCASYRWESSAHESETPRGIPYGAGGMSVL